MSQKKTTDRIFTGTPEQNALLRELYDDLGLGEGNACLYIVECTPARVAAAKAIGRLVTAADVHPEAASTVGTAKVLPGVPQSDPTRFVCALSIEEFDASGAVAAEPQYRIGSDNTYVVRWSGTSASINSWVRARNSRAGAPDNAIIAGAFPTSASVVLSPNGTAVLSEAYQYFLISWTSPNPNGGTGQRTVTIDFTADMVDPESKVSLGTWTMPPQQIVVSDGRSYRVRLTALSLDATSQYAPVMSLAGVPNPVTITFTGPATTDVTASTSLVGDGVVLIGSNGEPVR